MPHFQKPSPSSSYFYATLHIPLSWALYPSYYYHHQQHRSNYAVLLRLLVPLLFVHKNSVERQLTNTTSPSSRAHISFCCCCCPFSMVMVMVMVLVSHISLCTFICRLNNNITLRQLIHVSNTSQEEKKRITRQSQNILNKKMNEWREDTTATVTTSKDNMGTQVLEKVVMTEVHSSLYICSCSDATDNGPGRTGCKVALKHCSII